MSSIIVAGVPSEYPVHDDEHGPRGRYKGNQVRLAEGVTVCNMDRLAHVRVGGMHGGEE